MYFNLPLRAIYFDNDSEFLKLKTYLPTHGISYHTTPPYTPDLNGIAERRHYHIVEIGRALLHHAKPPTKFLTFTFQTTTYLINRLLTPNLNMRSPFQILHKT